MLSRVKFDRQKRTRHEGVYESQGFSILKPSCHGEARQVARDIVRTRQYDISMKLRMKVEMLFAHLKRILGMGRLSSQSPIPGQEGPIPFRSQAECEDITDAVLVQLDLLAESHKNLLFVATSNYPEAVDDAFVSRCDLVLEVPLPGKDACKTILRESLSGPAGMLKLTMPIEGDVFVPRYAYKALMKIGLSMLPAEELPNFQEAISSLEELDTEPPGRPLQLGFSYAFVSNAPPALAGTLLRRRDAQAQIHYMIFLLMAGSVCIQIWLPSDDLDTHVPKNGRLGIRFTAQLPKPEGGHFPITYSDPIQLDWTDLTPRLQPFSAFELTFNPQTAEGSVKPIPRT